MNKPTVMVLSGPESHFNIAKDVAGYLESLPNANVIIIKPKSDWPGHNGYIFFYRFVPFLSFIPTLFGKIGFVQQDVMAESLKSSVAELEQIIIKNKPQVIISSFWYYVRSLDFLKSKYNYKFINLVVDPANYIPLLISQQADYNFFCSASMAEYSQKIGFTKPQSVITERIVSKQLFSAVSKPKVKNHLPAFLICGGNQGSFAVIPHLLTILIKNSQKNFRVTIVSGFNNQLHSLVKLIKALVTPFVHAEIVPIGYTDKFTDLVSQSDIVLGKAGPNLIYESAIAKVPFIAITHIAGHETGNLEIIKSHHTGWVAENPITSASLISGYLKNPDMANDVNSHLQAFASSVYTAGVTLANTVRKELDD